MSLRLTYGLEVFGAPHVYITGRNGFDGGEARTDADALIARGDGELPGSHYQAARLLDFEGLVQADHLHRLVAMFQPLRTVERALKWTAEGRELRSFCRPTSTNILRSDAPPGWRRFQVALKASDPRIYGLQKQAELRPYTVTASGLNYPVADYPKQYGDDTTVTTVAHNGGDSDAHPTIRVRGPESGTIESWRLTNTMNGSQVQVDTPVGPGQLLTVRLRQWVTGDPSALIVELDGASRYGGWVSRPEVLWLCPGDNTLRFEVLTGEAPSSAELIWMDTWAGTRRTPPPLVA